MSQYDLFLCDNDFDNGRSFDFNERTFGTALLMCFCKNIKCKNDVPVPITSICNKKSLTYLYFAAVKLH